MDKPYRIVGTLGSPYSMKVRAIFRYRRIPHVFQMRDAAIRAETAHIRPQIIPMVKYPDDAAWHVDSTPIAREMEERLPDRRSILPDDPAHRFLSDLVEDFGDEWLTKAMFHYRWYYATDRDFASYWIATDQLPGATGGHAERKALAKQFADRQAGRMALVGCTDANRPVIERSYERLLDVLEDHVSLGTFLFGTRPSLGDFGLFGQLKILSDDPTGQQMMRQRAPTVAHWVRQMDDLSGIEGDWRPGDATLPEAVMGVLRLCGEAYLPFLAANLAALEDDAEEVALEIFARPYKQAPFRYQGKCYLRLKSLYARLEGEPKARVDALLEETGCLSSLA